MIWCVSYYNIWYQQWRVSYHDIYHVCLFTNYWKFLQCKNILWNQKCVKFSQTNTIFDSKNSYTWRYDISPKQARSKPRWWYFPTQAKALHGQAVWPLLLLLWQVTLQGLPGEIRNNNQKPFLLLLASWGHLTWHLFNTFIGEIWLIVLDWFVFLVSFPLPAF